MITCLSAALLASGCSCSENLGGDGEGEEDTAGEPPPAEGETEAEAPPEAEPQPEETVETIDTPDAAETAEDGEGDEVIPDVEEEEEIYDPSDCTMPPVIPEDPVDPAQTKFALQMLHFNIQYVAGGLQGFCPAACDYDEAETEDLIIRESFIPVLDFYLAHPDWKVDIELPSYMVEILAERFPDELHKLQILTQRGQVSLISFHYSAQLFLAFPSYDEEKSWEMTRDIFERYCLPLSTVVFNQEGQFGEGRHEFMRGHGYTIGVLPKNLFRYIRGDAPHWPYYTLRGTDVVIGPSDIDPASGIEVAWPFFDDGEKLAAANDLDPYFGDLYHFDPAKMVDYETQLQGLEDQGYKITTIKDYVSHLKGQGVAQPDMGPVLDGTWQPSSTDGLHRWLGGMGVVPWSVNERDNEVRTTNYRTRTLLEAADILIDYTETTLGVDYSAFRDSMTQAWRHLLLAEVSDATGINPWVGEINYSLNHCSEAGFIADYVFNEMKGDLGANYVSVDLLTRGVEELDAMPPPETFPPGLPPMAVQVSAPHRDIAAAWYDTGSAEGKTQLRLVVSFSAMTDITTDARTLIVSFPRTSDRIVYSPGLLETELVDYGLDEFIFQEGKHWLPLPNGIIGLGDGWYVIKHTQSVHVAARVQRDVAMIDFEDDTQPALESAQWVFELFNGSMGEALDLANRINVRPVVVK